MRVRLELSAEQHGRLLELAERWRQSLGQDIHTTRTLADTPGDFLPELERRYREASELVAVLGEGRRVRARRRLHGVLSGR